MVEPNKTKEEFMSEEDSAERQRNINGLDYQGIEEIGSDGFLEEDRSSNITPL